MCSAIWNHPLHGPTKCGQCMECRLAYSREWAIRMTHERMMHDRSCFLTLTYDDAHLPPYGQLVKKDLQDFFKRLRHVTGPFRYVACGEYGDLRRRPHFHVAMFGQDFSEDRIESGEGVKGHKLYVSPTLSRVWARGELLQQTIGSLDFESCAYIARYITKRISGVGASVLPLACDPSTGELVMPNPEFLLMSRKPMIGYSWMEKFFRTDVFPHGRVITEQGTPAPVPTAYKRRLNAMDRMKMRAVIESNVSRTLDNKRLEDSPERRAARSNYANARVKAFARDVKGS